MKQIELTRGLFALVDDEDYDLLSQWKWCAQKIGRTWYAARYKGKRYIYMHRYIKQASGREEVDHKNGNGLDNRRSNLRCVSRGLNCANKGMQGNNSIGFKGVCFDRQAGKFKASVCKDRKHHHCGFHDTAEEAAKAYDAGALRIYGEHARTNAMMGLLDVVS